MLFKFIATAVLAIGTAGVIMAINYLLGKRLPKWVLPAGIATAIISYQIIDEYSWHNRKLAGLAEEAGEIIVYHELAPRELWRPWSFVNAPVTKMEVFNRADIQDQGDGVYLAWITRINNLGVAEAHRPVAIDCAAGLTGDLFNEIADVEWYPIPEEDRARLCP